MLFRVVLPLLVVLAWPASAAAQTVSGPAGDFGDVAVGSAGPVIYLPVRADVPDVPITAITVDPPGDFSLGENTCGASVATSGCFIGVRFAPTAAGTRTSTVRFANGPTGVGTVSLTGNGVAPPANGPPGTPGAPGGNGSAGAPGAAGPQGIPGRAIQATCTAKGKPRKTTCRIVVLPDDIAATSVRVRLVRRGKTVARGSAAREGRVRLRGSRRVRPGRYSVRVSFEVDGRRVGARKVVRVR